MAIFTVFRQFRVEVSRPVEAVNFAEAESKMRSLPAQKFFKMAPGAELSDWDDLPGASIHEERE